MNEQLLIKIAVVIGFIAMGYLVLSNAMYEYNCFSHGGVKSTEYGCYIPSNTTNNESIEFRCAMECGGICQNKMMYNKFQYPKLNLTIS